MLKPHQGEISVSKKALTVGGLSPTGRFLLVGILVRDVVGPTLDLSSCNEACQILVL